MNRQLGCILPLPHPHAHGPLARTMARRQPTRASTKYTKPFSYNKNVQDSLAPAVRNLRFAVHPEPTPRTSTDCYIQHGELRAEHTTKANSYGDSENPLSYIHIGHSCHSSATSSREGERGFFIVGVGACCARGARGAYSGSRKRGS